MRLSRTDPAELARLAALQRAGGAPVRRLHPNGGIDAPVTTAEAPPPYTQRLGLRFLDETKVGFAPRPEALAALAYIGAGTKDISGQAPLIVARARGFGLEIARRYRSRRQALAFQFMLDRLQAWNLIAWNRAGRLIQIAVSGEAARLLPPAGRLASDALRR
jgi:hypothetical protein